MSSTYFYFFCNFLFGSAFALEDLKMPVIEVQFQDLSQDSTALLLKDYCCCNRSVEIRCRFVFDKS